MPRLLVLAQARISRSTVPIGYCIAVALVVISASILVPYLPPSYAAERLEGLAGQCGGYDFMQYVSTVGRQLQELSTPRNLFLLLNGIIGILLASSQVRVQAQRRPVKRDKSSERGACDKPEDGAPEVAENPGIVKEGGIASIIGDGGGVDYYAGNGQEEEEQQQQEQDAEASQLAAAAAPPPLSISQRSSSLRKHQPSKNPLRVINNPRGDARTIDATWKAINFHGSSARKAQAQAQAHHQHAHRKSETLSSFVHAAPQDPATTRRSSEDAASALARTLSSSSSTSNFPASSSNKKTNSFKVHKPQPKNTRVRREPSITQEELNAKVESFISRFNQQIRLERQESLLRYKEMVARSTS